MVGAKSKSCDALVVCNWLDTFTTRGNEQSRGHTTQLQKLTIVGLVKPMERRLP